MLKRIFALLLALLLCFALVACKDDEVPPETPDEGGSTGSTEGTEPTPEGPTAVISARPIGDSSVTWKLMSDGTLVIGGTGAMPNFANASQGNDERPWAEMISYITALRVEEGVSALGELAFKNLNQLKTAQLPASLAALPFAVFESCTALRTVSGGVGLTLIDENAFSNCPSLTTVSISTPLSCVALGAFSTGADKPLTLYFTGNESEWLATKEGMTVEGGNAAFESAGVTCFPKA